MSAAWIILAVVAFFAGLRVGRGSRTPFDMRCLPEMTDERWELVTEPDKKWCANHGLHHTTFSLGSVIAQNCGYASLAVSGYWFTKDRRLKRYGFGVIRTQLERIALDSTTSLALPPTPTKGTPDGR